MGKAPSWLYSWFLSMHVLVLCFRQRVLRSMSAPNNACSGQVGTRRVFGAFFAALTFSRFDGESQPSHLPLTRAVGWLFKNVVRSADII